MAQERAVMAAAAEAGDESSKCFDERLSPRTREACVDAHRNSHQRLQQIKLCGSLGAQRLTLSAQAECCLYSELGSEERDNQHWLIVPIVR